MVVLVTSAAGFIDFHICRRLLETGHNVIAIDNINDYYDTFLKRSRLLELEVASRVFDSKYNFFELDIVLKDSLQALFTKYEPLQVIHLAAQAGVRCSIQNLQAYIQSYLVGFANVL